MTPDPWAEVTAARLPAAGLACLAAVRDRAGVRVQVGDGVAWVTWPAGTLDVVACLLPATGVEFFAPRGREWFRFGSRVPTSARPPADGRPLDAVVVPERVTPVPPTTHPGERVQVRVVRGGPPREPTALRCSMTQLLAWADAATTFELASVRAARCGGSRAVVRGERLPVVAGALRFWGTAVLVPLGYRTEPALSEGVLRTAAGASADDVLVLDEAGGDIIPTAAFGPLTRAGARLAAGAVR